MKQPFTAKRFALIAALLLLSASVTASELAQQRQLFRDVYDSVERGSWQAVDNLAIADRQRLEQYILWPDLRATWLRANIRTAKAAEIDAFIQQYGTLRPARELRYRYALNRAGKDDLSGFLRIYEQFYQGLDIARLDCLALQAEIRAGRYQRVNGRAIDLWMVGRSQVNECDPVFDYLGKQKLLGTAEYQRRFELAVGEENYSLARWLAKQIDQSHVDIAGDWLQAQANPEDFLRAHLADRSNQTRKEQLVYALKRLTYRDPQIASALWQKASRQQRFSEAQKLRTVQHIALWAARDNLPGAYALLQDLAAAAQTDEVLRWRARLSLRDANWTRLITDIAEMSAAEQATEEWRYWKSAALERSGQANAAAADLNALSQERSYYGFLAADKLGKAYALADAGLVADEAHLSALEAHPAIARARELYHVGQDSRGRSEWDAAIRNLTRAERAQAAILAHRWGWHSRAIATAASLGEYDDLSLRYPLPYRATFQEYSNDARIAQTWAYGIARSESLFMPDVKSSAGAIGLMQLMPATGRDVAGDLEVPYAGLATLVDPDSNIRLGTTYLGQMAERYGGNPVPATAAYNAGPHRVDGWLPGDGTIDARIWIENIPFNETRKYVKRVLAAQTIFHWRLTGKIRRLSNDLTIIRASGDETKLARR